MLHVAVGEMGRGWIHSNTSRGKWWKEVEGAVQARGAPRKAAAGREGSGVDRGCAKGAIKERDAKDCYARRRARRRRISGLL